MADINIAALPSAGAFADADIFHISQSGADYKTTMSALDARFSKVDIFGLTENTSPTSSLFVATAVDGTIANNRKVSLAKVAELVQAEAFFTNDEDIDVDDEVPFRKDNAATLKQCTVGGLAKRILTLNELPDAIVAADVVDSDFGVIYDTSTSLPKKATIANYRQAMLATGTLSALTDVDIDNADLLYVYDSSTSTAKKITYSNIKAAIVASLPFADYLSSTTADSAAGLIDFQAGIKTNSIVPSSGTDITINAKLTVNSEVASAKGSFTNVSGKLFGAAGDATNLYMTTRTSGADTIWDVKAKQFNPVVSNETSLGTASLKWLNIFSAAGNIDALTVATSAALPNATTIRNAANTSNLSLMNSDVINLNILPVATDTTKGIVELATTAEALSGDAGASTHAITAAVLGALSSFSGSDVPVSSGGYTAPAGSTARFGKIKIGGLLINYGWIRFISTENAAITVDLTANGLSAYNDAKGYVCIPIATRADYDRVSAVFNTTSTATTLKFGVGQIGSSGKADGAMFITIGKSTL